MSVRLLIGDALTQLRTLADESVQCCVTSPPYWGLRDYGVPGQLGLEPTPDLYLTRMVEVFREVKRVLRDDGTAWVNMGDSYAGGGGFSINAPTSASSKSGKYGTNGALKAGGIEPQGVIKPKDLCGIPWRLAFALQADGWWLRQDIVWAKPNPMPESVTDRCTKAHEYLFLLAKRATYYYDAQAIAEELATPEHAPGNIKLDASRNESSADLCRAWSTNGSRNARSVWTIPTSPFPDAHFATFPPELPRRCILAGTSEKGCCEKCGAPRVRVVERQGSQPYRTGKSAEKERNGLVTAFSGYADGSSAPTFTTVGWRPSCSCDAPAVPCVVLDPFAGAGTTLLVADRLGRDAIGIELNPAYAAMAERRIRDDAPLLAAIAECATPPNADPAQERLL